MSLESPCEFGPTGSMDSADPMSGVLDGIPSFGLEGLARLPQRSWTGDLLFGMGVALACHLIAVIALATLGFSARQPGSESPVLMVSLLSLGEPGGGCAGEKAEGRAGPGEEVQSRSTSGTSGSEGELLEPSLERFERLEATGAPEPESPAPVVSAPRSEKKPFAKSCEPPKPRPKPNPNPRETPARRAARARPSPSSETRPMNPSAPPSAAVSEPRGGGDEGRSGREGNPAGTSGANGSTGDGGAGGAGGSPLLEYQLAQVDTPPVVVAKVEPDYPYMARRQNLSGKLVIKFLVDREGRVKRPCILQAMPQGVFDRCVLEALEKWRFKPGIYRGRPVATWVVLPIQFKLSG